MTTFDFSPGQHPPPTGGTHTLVQGRSFTICSPGGDMVDGIQGVFVGDTRIGSHLRLTVDGEPVECLASSTQEPAHGAFVGRTAEPHLLVFRDYWMGRGLRADVRIHNPTGAPRAAQVDIHVASDLADLFDVKGSRAVGPPIAPNPTPVGMEFHDAPTARGAMVSAVPTPEVIGDRLHWEFTVEGHADWTCCLEWRAIRGETVFALEHPCGTVASATDPMTVHARWRQERPELRSDVVDLERVYRQTLDDLGALRIFEGDHGDSPVVAAGAPWFMTLFGRDSLITSWMALPVDPLLGLSTVRLLARLQGTKEVPATDEQPGRILHEVRAGETPSLSLAEGSIYYGTSDATSLFVMLVHELWRWGVPLAELAPLLPNVEAALGWMATWGDADRDGYIEYRRASRHGLLNQGWKDSGDAIHYADGTLADAPIALCEVQGYAYAAWLGAAALAEASGDPDKAAQWTARAAELRRAFNRDFWLDEHQAFAIALDGDKRPVNSVASNMAHCLWTGIVDAERAAPVARWLMSPELSSGWGVRTLATSMARYDPLSYHNGSVWPHDTAIAIAGLRRAGFVDEALALGGQLLAAAGPSHRLPELYSGLTPADLSIPVPYPASCSPQAWAAAAPLLVLRAMLGFEPDAPRRTITLDPRLPPDATTLALDGMPFGDERLTIEVERDAVAVRGLPKGYSIVRTSG